MWPLQKSLSFSIHFGAPGLKLSLQLPPRNSPSLMVLHVYESQQDQQASLVSSSSTRRRASFASWALPVNNRQELKVRITESPCASSQPLPLLPNKRPVQSKVSKGQASKRLCVFESLRSLTVSYILLQSLTRLPTLRSPSDFPFSPPRRHAGSQRHSPLLHWHHPD